MLGARKKWGREVNERHAIDVNLNRTGSHVRSHTFTCAFGISSFFAASPQHTVLLQAVWQPSWRQDKGGNAYILHRLRRCRSLQSQRSRLDLYNNLPLFSQLICTLAQPISRWMKSSHLIIEYCEYVRTKGCVKTLVSCRSNMESLTIAEHSDRA